MFSVVLALSTTLSHPWLLVERFAKANLGVIATVITQPLAFICFSLNYSLCGRIFPGNSFKMLISFQYMLWQLLNEFFIKPPVYLFLFWIVNYLVKEFFLDIWAEFTSPTHTLNSTCLFCIFFHQWVVLWDYQKIQTVVLWLC